MWGQQVKNQKSKKNFIIAFIFFGKFNKDWNFILLWYSSLKYYVHCTDSKKLGIYFTLDWLLYLGYPNRWSMLISSKPHFVVVKLVMLKLVLS